MWFEGGDSVGEQFEVQLGDYTLSSWEFMG